MLIDPIYDKHTNNNSTDVKIYDKTADQEIILPQSSDAGKPSTNIDSLHDDEFFHILTFLCSSTGIGSIHQPINSLFRRIAYVSKDFHRHCLDFVRRTALDLYWRSANPTRTMFHWMAKQRVRIQKIVIHLNDLESIFSLKMIARICHLHQLRHLELTMGGNISFCRETIEKNHRFLLHAGVPESIADPSCSVLSIFAKRAKNIELMSLNISLNLCPLLSKWSLSLMELHLTITKKQCAFTSETGLTDDQEEFAALSKTIQMMKALTFLNLNIRFPSKLKIRSNSLELINSYSSHKDVWVLECICPSLQTFVCRNQANGVQPEIPLSRREVERYEGKESIQVKQVPFKGMSVPDNCEVFFQLTWSDLVGEGGADDLM